MVESDIPIQIERSRPLGEGHPLAQPSAMAEVSSAMAPKQEMVRLVDYLRDIAGKPRGDETKGKEDLNSHAEEFIVREGNEIKIYSLAELQNVLRSLGANVDVLGVQSIGNPNQKVTAMVQGVNRENPASGFERPTLAEGPHMILAPYAIDKDGKLHLFRTIQMRTGEAVIDTPRGFADAKTLENGQQMYDVENSGENVIKNMTRIVGEESGDALQINKVIFLGSPRVNSAFVTSKSAVFGVEVDYEKFIQSQKVVTEAELRRRQEQLEHEGIVGDVLDIPLDQYIMQYKKDSGLDKDMAADFGTDTVVIDFLAEKLTDIENKYKTQKRHLSAEGEANRKFKKEDPEGYVKQRLRVSEAKHPENAEENRRKAEQYLSRLYSQNLKKTS